MSKFKLFLWLLSALVFFSSVSTASADEVDDLLNKCGIAPDPKPSVMVYDYELSPETLMPGDLGVLTVTLKNMQEEPIEKDVDIKEEVVADYTTVEKTTTTKKTTTKEDTTKEKGTTTEEETTNTIKEKVEPKTRTIDIDAETRFTMDAFVKEAYILENNDFKVYNKYLSAGVVGPDEKIDFAFKIKAPAEEGIFMLKFVADIEDTEGKNSKGIRYFIPVTVAGTLKIMPLEVSQNEVRLQVVNEGLSDADCVFVVANATASSGGGLEFEQEEIYLGRIKSGESAVAVFKVCEAEEGENSAVAVFKATYKNGVNEHESNQVCVKMLSLRCGGGEKEEEKEKEVEEETVLLLEGQGQPETPLGKRLGAGFAVAVLVEAVAGAVAVGFGRKKGKRRSREEGGGEE